MIHFCVFVCLCFVNKKNQKPYMQEGIQEVGYGLAGNVKGRGLVSFIIFLYLCVPLELFEPLFFLSWES